jgi:hypothetical protein
MLAVALYGYLHYFVIGRGRDPMRVCAVDRPAWLCAMTDGWALSHFLFYGMLGAVFPDHFGISMIVSVGWELFEFLLGKVPWFTGIIEQVSSDSQQFWYGKPTDLLVNAAGFWAGAQLGIWLF